MTEDGKKMTENDQKSLYSNCFWDIRNKRKMGDSGYACHFVVILYHAENWEIQF